MTAKHSDTIYEYKKIKPIETLYMVGIHNIDTENCIRTIKNKLDELTIEQNHLMKDFELYKKAFKQFVREMREINALH